MNTSNNTDKSFLQNKVEDLMFITKFGHYPSSQAYNEIEKYIKENPSKADVAARYLMNQLKSPPSDFKGSNRSFNNAVKCILDTDPEKFAPWGIEMINTGIVSPQTQNFSFCAISLMAEKNPETIPELMKTLENHKCNVETFAGYSEAVASVASTNNEYTSWGCSLIQKNLDETLTKDNVVYDDAFCGLEIMANKNPSSVPSIMHILADEKYAKANLGEIPMYYYYDRAIRSCIKADPSYATQELYDLVRSRKVAEGGSYSTGWEASLASIEEANPAIESNRRSDKSWPVLQTKNHHEQR